MAVNKMALQKEDDELIAFATPNEVFRKKPVIHASNTSLTGSSPAQSPDLHGQQHSIMSHVPTVPNNRKYSGSGKPFPDNFPGDLAPVNSNLSELDYDIKSKRKTYAIGLSQHTLQQQKIYQQQLQEKQHKSLYIPSYKDNRNKHQTAFDSFNMPPLPPNQINKASSQSLPNSPNYSSFSPNTSNDFKAMSAHRLSSLPPNPNRRTVSNNMNKSSTVSLPDLNDDQLNQVSHRKSAPDLSNDLANMSLNGAPPVPQIPKQFQQKMQQQNAYPRKPSNSQQEAQFQQVQVNGNGYQNGHNQQQNGNMHSQGNVYRNEQHNIPSQQRKHSNEHYGYEDTKQFQDPTISPLKNVQIRKVIPKQPHVFPEPQSATIQYPNGAAQSTNIQYQNGSVPPPRSQQRPMQSQITNPQVFENTGTVNMPGNFNTSTMIEQKYQNGDANGVHHVGHPNSDLEGAIQIEEKLRFIFEAVNVTKTGYLNPSELQKALLNTDNSKFHLSTVKIMIRVFDKTGKDAIDFREFYHLWSFVSKWRKVFLNTARHDGRGNSSSISVNQYQQALESLGYRLGSETINYMYNLFATEGENDIDQHVGIKSLKLDMFVESLIWLMKSTSSFKRFDVQRNGIGVFPFDNYVQEILSFRYL